MGLNRHKPISSILSGNLGNPTGESLRRFFSNLFAEFPQNNLRRFLNSLGSNASKAF